MFTEEFWQKVSTGLLNWLITELPSLIITVIIFLLTITFFTKLMRKVKPMLLTYYGEKSVNKSEAQKRMTTLVDLINSSLKIVLWVVFIIILLSKVGVEIAPLLAGAGIFGLAIGFGAQELIRDVISGFFILLENQIRVGDVAIINLTGGTVEKIELRTITLRDLTGTVHIFQNGKITSLSNVTKDWSAVVFEIGVAYKENINDVITLMENVANELINDEAYKTKIIEKMEIMGLERFDNSAVVIRARIKTLPGEQWAVKREYQNRLKTCFDNAKIEIPFPHTTLYWGEKTPPLKIQMENKE